MFAQTQDHIGIAFDQEVATVVAADADLPDVPALVVFLSLEGGIAKVFEEARGRSNPSRPSP